MFRIYDGRDYFYQWDIDRKIIVEDKTVTEVHFCNRTDDCSLICEVYSEGNLRIVNVPNILLQDNWRINVYAYDGSYTKHATKFEVKSRTKPAGYVYTETELKNYEDLAEKIAQIEKNGVSDEQIAEAVERYLDENDINVDVDLSDYATKEYVDSAIANIEVSGGSGLTTTAIGLLINILQEGVYNSNVSNKIIQLQEALNSNVVIPEPEDPDTPDEPDIPDEPDVPVEPDVPDEPNTPDEPVVGEAVALSLDSDDSKAGIIFTDGGLTRIASNISHKTKILSNDTFAEDTKVKVKLTFTQKTYDCFFAGSYESGSHVFYGEEFGSKTWIDGGFTVEHEIVVRAGYKLAIVSHQPTTVYAEFSAVSLGKCEMNDKEYEALTAPVQMASSKVKWYADDGVTAFTDSSATGRNGYHTCTKIFENDTNVRITIPIYGQTYSAFYVSNTQWDGVNTNDTIALNYAMDMSETDAWVGSGTYTIDYQIKAGNRLCVSSAVSNFGKVFVEVI